jgi:hypothetical protein
MLRKTKGGGGGEGVYRTSTNGIFSPGLGGEEGERELYTGNRWLQGARLFTLHTMYNICELCKYTQIIQSFPRILKGQGDEIFIKRFVSLISSIEHICNMFLSGVRCTGSKFLPVSSMIPNFLTSANDTGGTGNK